MAEGTTEGATESKDDATTNSNYECNICLDTAKDAVVSYCGHLFCWPCLHQWLETRPNRKMCPVCKAGIDRDKVIPLYGRGSTNNTDPRDKMPPRPSAQRSEPENTGAFGHLNMNNLHMSFGIGAFPFTLFASTFWQNDGRPANPVPGSPQHNDEVVLSKLFLAVAIFFTVWLLIA